MGRVWSLRPIESLEFATGRKFGIASLRHWAGKTFLQMLNSSCSLATPSIFQLYLKQKLFRSNYRELNSLQYKIECTQIRVLGVEL